MNRLFAFLTAVTLAAGPATSARPPKVLLGPVSARLYYSDKGALSGNLLARSSTWTGWNTIIGEGDAGGAASDVLVELPVSAPGAEDSVTADKPLIVIATKHGKAIARRTFTNILIPFKGRSFSALYLADVACAGRIDIVATLAGQVRKARLNMDCGE